MAPPQFVFAVRALLVSLYVLPLVRLCTRVHGSVSSVVLHNESSIVPVAVPSAMLELWAADDESRERPVFPRRNSASDIIVVHVVLLNVYILLAGLWNLPSDGSCRYTLLACL